MVGGERSIELQREHRQHGALLLGSEHGRPVAKAGLDRSEETDFHADVSAGGRDSASLLLRRRATQERVDRSLTRDRPAINRAAAASGMFTEPLPRSPSCRPVVPAVLPAPSSAPSPSPPSPHRPRARAQSTPSPTACRRPRPRQARSKPTRLPRPSSAAPTTTSTGARPASAPAPPARSSCSPSVASGSARAPASAPPADQQAKPRMTQNFQRRMP